MAATVSVHALEAFRALVQHRGHHGEGEGRQGADGPGGPAGQGAPGTDWDVVGGGW